MVNLHLGFNVALLILCLPLTGPVAKLVTRLVKPKPTAEQLANPLSAAVSALDQSVIGVPALALASATRELLRMAEIIERMLKPLMELYETGDPEKIKQAKRLEEAVDAAQSDIKLYLARITYAGEDDAQRGHELSSFAINLEHVGDAISKTLLKLAETRRDQKLQFSPEGWRELNELHHRVMGNMQLALNVLVSKDRESARQLLAEKDAMGSAERASYGEHLRRLRSGAPESHRDLQHPPRNRARAQDDQLALRVGRLPDPARKRRPARQPARRKSLALDLFPNRRRNMHPRLAKDRGRLRANRLVGHQIADLVEPAHHLELRESQLALVHHEDAAVGLLQHRALDRDRLGVRVRDLLPADPARAHDHRIGGVPPDELERLRPERRVLAIVVVAGAKDHADRRVGAEHRRVAEAVGDRRELDAARPRHHRRDLLADMHHRRAGIDHHDPAVGDELDRGLSHPPAPLRVDPRPLADAGLVVHRRDGAAIGARQQPLLAQLVDVAPDGFLGDVIAIGEIAKPDAGRDPDLVEDLLLTVVLAKLHHLSARRFRTGASSPRSARR